MKPFKYSVDDKVWFIRNNKIDCGIVKSINYYSGHDSLVKKSVIHDLWYRILLPHSGNFIDRREGFLMPTHAAITKALEEGSAKDQYEETLKERAPEKDDE